ncbi:proton-translocating NADH-quinone oxidoreductase, chain M [Gaiella occulta]|uniref:Proton-translocating NADH-quinone oxidoreductase, chain M n=1 Tax=Gaiella occulta TaxID=1002870 RepID=A0A7M2YVK7_9ACTN|nr:NADH-quinone oxidoreductase subunit M [Gaiella occulta]RDI74171.1 proton-translocating NADH-quinone oxidoreductase, chain M [Gaiella occulta]
MLTTLLIVLPLVAAAVVWAAPLPREATAGIASLVALVEVGLWILALLRFDFGSSALQHSAQREWFSDLGVSYHVGFYGFSLWLAGLTVALGAAAIGFGMWVGRDRARAYYGLMLFLVGAVVGVFASQDLLLFYVFFEAMLIPIYILVGVWGGPNRAAATIMFVVYTMAGSLLMLASIVAFGLSQGTFDLIAAGTSDNDWVFLGFAVAFAVKAPLFPFHGWLRAAYTEAPPEVAALLSGVVSKAAVFGFVWIVLRHFPGPVGDWRTVILVLAATGLVYGSLLAFRQPDMRGVVAYSSMGQMGLITLGIFAGNDLGLGGAVLQSVGHGLVSAAMFLLAGMVIERTGSDRFADLGGMAKGRPVLATIVMIVGMLTLAVPGSANFAGEFAILAGVFAQGWGYAAVGAVAIVLAAMYTLRLISAVLHRASGAAIRAEALDLRPGEVALVLPLVLALLALSAWPAAVSDRSFPDRGPAGVISEAAE